MMDCSTNISLLNMSNTTSANTPELPELCEFSNCPKISRIMLPVQVVIGVLTFLANIISVIILIRLYSLAPVLRLALLSLSATDVIGSAAFLYHIIRSNFDISHIGIECKVRYVIYVAMNVITLTTLTYLSVERLISICIPFIHEKLDGYKFTAAALTINWIVALSVLISGMHKLRNNISICMYHLLVPRTTHFLNALLALGSILTIVFINVSLYVYARKQISKIGNTIVGEEREHRIATMENKATMTTITIVVPFVLFNTPLYVLMLYFYARPEYMSTCDSVSVLNALSSLLVVNSLCNPIIYAWKLAIVRARLKEMFCCFLDRSANPSMEFIRRSSQS